MAAGIDRARAAAVSITVSNRVLDDWSEAEGVRQSAVNSLTLDASLGGDDRRARTAGAGARIVAVTMVEGLIAHSLVGHHSHSVVGRRIGGSLSGALMVYQLAVITHTSHMHGSVEPNSAHQANATMTLDMVLRVAEVEAAAVSVAIAVAVVGVAIAEVRRSGKAIGWEAVGGDTLVGMEGAGVSLLVDVGIRRTVWRI